MNTVYILHGHVLEVVTSAKYLSVDMTSFSLRKKK